MKVTKAVIPAAGLGTRFLPVTKAMPKEMLPIIDTPAIHYVVKEALDAGLDDIIIITGRGKRAVEDYFDESPELEMHLRKAGNTAMLDLVEEISTMANIHYIRQKAPKGLPDAILAAHRHIGDEPFAVLLGDDIIVSQTPCIAQLLSVFSARNASVIAVQDVPREKINRYGAVAADRVADPGCELFKIRTIVEKPRPQDAPSTLAAIGRYVFTPEVFEAMRQTRPGVNNELQIADSINILSKTQPVYACAYEGERYDVGDKLGYVEAVVDFALKNAELRDGLLSHLRARSG